MNKCGYQFPLPETRWHSESRQKALVDDHKMQAQEDFLTNLDPLEWHGAEGLAAGSQAVEAEPLYLNPSPLESPAWSP